MVPIYTPISLTNCIQSRHDFLVKIGHTNPPRVLGVEKVFLKSMSVGYRPVGNTVAGIRISRRVFSWTTLLGLRIPQNWYWKQRSHFGLCDAEPASNALSQSRLPPGPRIAYLVKMDCTAVLFFESSYEFVGVRSVFKSVGSYLESWSTRCIRVLYSTSQAGP